MHTTERRGLSSPGSSHLQHKPRNDAVKLGALIPEWLLLGLEHKWQANRQYPHVIIMKYILARIKNREESISVLEYVRIKKMTNAKKAKIKSTLLPK